MMLTLYLILIALLLGERLLELRISRRNADRLRARGAIEVGQQHYRWMTLLHSAWFVGCLLEVLALDRRFDPRLGAAMLTLALSSQLLRYWTIRTLGEHWNVRVIVVPGAPAVSSGPFRYLRHPNYLAVVIEGAAVPLMHGAWLTATLFTVLNALLLTVRIRCEERALAEHCDYASRLGRQRRLLPQLPRRRRAARGEVGA